MNELLKIKQLLEPGLQGIGITQILWPNYPKKRTNTIPYAQIDISYDGRTVNDLGLSNRTRGIVSILIATPYGFDPESHDSYVQDSLAILSDIAFENIQFFTSSPKTLGRRDAWWMTRVETRFNLEGV